MPRGQIRALTGLCYCSSCGQTLSYAPARKRYALRCTTIHCAQRAKPIMEKTLISYALDAVREKAPNNLAAAVMQEGQSAKARLLRQEIDHLLSFNDPDLRAAIANKRLKLNRMTDQAQRSAGLVMRIKDPAWMDTASYDEATIILHSMVRQIRVTRQEPEAVHLRL